MLENLWREVWSSKVRKEAMQIGKLAWGSVQSLGSHTKEFCPCKKFRPKWHLWLPGHHCLQRCVCSSWKACPRPWRCNAKQLFVHFRLQKDMSQCGKPFTPRTIWKSWSFLKCPFRILPGSRWWKHSNNPWGVGQSPFHEFWFSRARLPWSFMALEVTNAIKLHVEAVQFEARYPAFWYVGYVLLESIRQVVWQKDIGCFKRTAKKIIFTTHRHSLTVYMAIQTFFHSWLNILGIDDIRTKTIFCNWWNRETSLPRAWRPEHHWLLLRV